MNGSKRSSAMLQSSATGEPSPPSEQMESVLPRLPLEKQLSIPSCRYGVRAGRPAPQSKPYGVSSDLVVTASDQRMDAAAAAAVTMSVRAFAPHYLHYWVRFQHRKRIGADRWQSGRRGRTDHANEDRSKNVTHLGTPFGPIGALPDPHRMLSTVCPRLGGRTLVLAPCERLGDPAREVRYWGRKPPLRLS